MPRKITAGVPYVITSIGASNALDLKTPDNTTLISHTLHGRKNQVWWFEDAGSGLWHIKSGTGKYLEAPPDPIKGSKPVGGTTASKWSVVFDPKDESIFIIYLVGTNWVLDVSTGSKINGTPIILYGPHGGRNQSWSILPIDPKYM